MYHYFGEYRDLPRQLEAHASELKLLATMPDRVTKADIEKAEKALGQASAALESLMKGNLPGCLCHHIDNGDYSYLNYNETCPHHRALHAQQEAAKKHYEKASEKLKNEVRIKLVGELIGGLARGEGMAAQHLVKRAVELADEAIAALQR